MIRKGTAMILKGILVTGKEHHLIAIGQQHFKWDTVQMGEEQLEFKWDTQ